MERKFFSGQRVIYSGKETEILYVNRDFTAVIENPEWHRNIAVYYSQNNLNYETPRIIRVSLNELHEVPGTVFIVVSDCFCSCYEHEKFKYPTMSIEEKKLKSGDIVTLVKSWSNLYGNYYRVSKGEKEYDIPPVNLKKSKT